MVSHIDAFRSWMQRATGPVLTSVKEEKDVICPSTLNFAMRKGKLRIYIVQNLPDISWKLAPFWGYKECGVVSFV